MSRTSKNTNNTPIRGGGNHFVDICEVYLEADNLLKLDAGSYTAILSHSGSRGLGAAIAEHFTQIAKETCRLPREAGPFAWLDLNSEVGKLGIIPANMTDAGLLVTGLGFKEALCSASHGAGRAMSRQDARNSFSRHALNRQLAKERLLLSLAADFETSKAQQDRDVWMNHNTLVRGNPVRRFKGDL